MGWRLRTLRQRHNLTLVEVARLAGLDVSYLSRLERDALQNAKPKPDTISRVLDALGATIEESEAVCHIERPPLTSAQIEEAIGEIAREEDASPDALLLADEHWYIHYYNATARAILGLSPDEYRRTVGGHMLHYIIDPDQPRYYRVPDDDRKNAFESRSRMFKLNFASEEFDVWYQNVVDGIRKFPWAFEAWENLAPAKGTRVIGRDEINLVHPVVGWLRVLFQLNRLMTNPRFFLVMWTPADARSFELVGLLREQPDYNYPVVDQIATPEAAGEVSSISPVNSRVDSLTALS